MELLVVSLPINSLFSCCRELHFFIWDTAQAVNISISQSSSRITLKRPLCCLDVRRQRCSTKVQSRQAWLILIFCRTAHFCWDVYGMWQTEIQINVQTAFSSQYVRVRQIYLVYYNRLKSKILIDIDNAKCST
jgi:hypothetical protein